MTDIILNEHFWFIIKFCVLGNSSQEFHENNGLSGFGSLEIYMSSTISGENHFHAIPAFRSGDKHFRKHKKRTRTAKQGILNIKLLHVECAMWKDTIYVMSSLCTVKMAKFSVTGYVDTYGVKQDNTVQNCIRTAKNSN